MANETQNCGYPKLGTDDFYDIEDFNRAIEMIDGDIGEIQEAVSALGDGKADKKDVSQHLSTENPHNITKETVGLGNVPNVATDDQTPTFTQAASRENIASGEKLSVVFGKIGKWLADLKAVAFTGSYNDLADRPEIPAATRVKGNAESSYRMGDVNITPADIGLGNVNNTADSVKNVNSAGNLRVLNDNYKQGTDLPSTYPRGVTVFFSIDPANKFNGITYCTIHTIKGYGNMACIQFLYPYNTDHDKVYFREAIYNNDAWRPWREVITTANIASQNVASATKATLDSEGNAIADTYAKRSIYGDNVVGLGRKYMSAIGEKSATLGGDINTASGRCSATLGGNSNTVSGNYSSASGGYNSTVSGSYSSALGGSNNTASDTYSVTLGGENNTASGKRSSTMGGSRLFSENDSSVATGHYNAQMTTGGNTGNTTGTAFAIGNGTSNSALSNAFSVMFDGRVKAKSTITGSTTADYAEFFEWADGNPDAEDRVGRFVTLAGNKIAIADSGASYILGIVSGEPFVLGNGDCDTWNGMFLKDDFNRTIYEPAPKMKPDEGTGELAQETDGDGNLVYEGTRPKLNPEYDPTQPYVSRFDRKEWAPVGMLGVLSVIDDGTCVPGRFCRCGAGGTATLAEDRGTDTFFVIERKTDSIVSVILK